MKLAVHKIQWKIEYGIITLEEGVKQYENLIKKPVVTNVIHGGLETGMISTRLKGLQMVSLGPTIEGLHSPSEKLKISDMAVIYQLLKNIIINLEELNL